MVSHGRNETQRRGLRVRNSNCPSRPPIGHCLSNQQAVIPDLSRSDCHPGFVMVRRGTARLSRSRFSYVFQVNPGQKIVRLHFNPAPYKGFKRFKDLFSVEAASFTLVSNFSASLTTDALGVNSTAFEIIRRLNIKHEDSVSSGGDIGDLFEMWGTFPKRKASNINHNVMTWKISVDVGFRYLVRLHFSVLGHKISQIGGVSLQVRVNQMVADIKFDIFGERDDGEEIISWYRDYIVMMDGNKQEGKRDLFICVQSNGNGFMDIGHRILKGFEIMKLSNPDHSLASPNPLPSSARVSSYWTTQNLNGNITTTVAIALLTLLNTIVHALRQVWEARFTEEENKPSARAERLCRRFSLVEIQLATRNFSDAYLIGRGGFGKVYKGLIDNGRETVAIKRQKSNSRQGAREFLTEIETLTELRHVNLVSLIGYCNEHGEMILVYEYMACGTLADHLYKLARNNDNCSSLTWKKRLAICIGAVIST
ncbi:hypothetical protein DH2020_019165 [Rehmannia glutinosa]|uniref:Protein kinase domain-containing protein n=1 Tax=Rehmannia glutinosa TaxID=99300 RepID=A0ABR0WL10_REHGL